MDEAGAAIARQLNGPLTALLLYVGEIKQHSHREPAAHWITRLKRVMTTETALRDVTRPFERRGLAAVPLSKNLPRSFESAARRARERSEPWAGSARW